MRIGTPKRTRHRSARACDAVVLGRRDGYDALDLVNRLFAMGGVVAGRGGWNYPRQQPSLKRGSD